MQDTEALTQAAILLGAMSRKLADVASGLADVVDERNEAEFVRDARHEIAAMVGEIENQP
jgi:hypothetical protein